MTGPRSQRKLSLRQIRNRGEQTLRPGVQRQGEDSGHGSLPGSPRADGPWELLMAPTCTGLTRLESRSKQSLFSLVPKLMMPWRERQGGRVSIAKRSQKEGLKCTWRQKSKAGTIAPSQTPFLSLVGPPLLSATWSIFPFLKLCSKVIFSRKPPQNSS